MSASPSNAESPGRSVQGQNLFPLQDRLPFVLVTALFFLWGMSNNLTDILVQQFRKALELSPLQAQLVQTAVFLGYFCMALPASILTWRRGYKAGILLGLCLFSGGMLLFWPAAASGRYAWLLSALFIVGCGSAALEAAANPYVAQAGPSATSERRLNFSQAFNPPGTITGVLVGTFFIFSGVELTPERIGVMKAQGVYTAYLHRELMRVVPTYVSLGCVVLVLTGIISATRFTRSARKMEDGLVSVRMELRALATNKQLMTAAATQFCYCGAQIATWSAFIPYMRQYAATTERTAGLFLTANLVAFAMGRLISTSLMRWFRPARMTALYALLNIGLVLLGVLLPGRIGTGSIVLSSFFMSIMFPTVFALGIKGLGSRTELASSVLTMSVVGGAVIPPLLGSIARSTDSYALGYLVVVACYGVVAFYGLSHNHDRTARLGPTMP